MGSRSRSGPDVAINLDNLAQLLVAKNGLAEAEPLLRPALIIDKKSFGTGAPAAFTEKLRLRFRRNHLQAARACLLPQCDGQSDCIKLESKNTKEGRLCDEQRF